MDTVLILGGLGFDLEDAQHLAKQESLKLVHAPMQNLRCIIANEETRWKVIGVTLRHVNAIWVRGLFTKELHRNDTQQAALVADFLTYMRKRFPQIVIIDEWAFQKGSIDKLKQVQILAAARVTVPKSQLAITVNQGYYFPFPVVVKPMFACDGKGIERFEDTQAYRAWANSSRVYFPALVQEWIPNDADYRVLIVGGRIVATVKRTREGGILNNPTRNVAQEIVELPSGALMLAQRAAQASGLEIAGVDLIQHKETGEWYVLEVNQSPDLSRIQEAGIESPLATIITFIARNLQSR